jgi:hypothetical protein
MNTQDANKDEWEFDVGLLRVCGDVCVRFFVFDDDANAIFRSMKSASAHMQAHNLGGNVRASFIRACVPTDVQYVMGVCLLRICALCPAASSTV